MCPHQFIVAGNRSITLDGVGAAVTFAALGNVSRPDSALRAVNLFDTAALRRVFVSVLVGCFSMDLRLSCSLLKYIIYQYLQFFPMFETRSDRGL